MSSLAREGAQYVKVAQRNSVPLLGCPKAGPWSVNLSPNATQLSPNEKNGRILFLFCFVLQNSMWPGSCPCSFSLQVSFPHDYNAKSGLQNGPHPTVPPPPSFPEAAPFPLLSCFKEETSLLLLETNASTWIQPQQEVPQQQCHLLPALGTFLSLQPLSPLPIGHSYI